MAGKRIMINISEGIQRIIGLTDKKELSTRLAEIVDRYCEIIKRTDREVRRILSDKEIQNLVLILKGAAWEPAALIDGGIAAEIVDADDECFDCFTDQKNLIDKVRRMTFAQQVVLVEWENGLSRRSR